MTKKRCVKTMIAGLACALVLTALAAAVFGQPYPPPKPRGNRAMPGRGASPVRTLVLPAQVAAFKSLSVILGMPTDKSVIVSILSQDDKDVFIEYGETSGHYTDRTAAQELPAGAPVEIPLRGLRADTQYFYLVRYRRTGEDAFARDTERCFHTQRAPGSTFQFDIQGDSHPERIVRQFDAELYAQTLGAAAEDRPDFYMTIGDDFSVDELTEVNPETVNSVYYNQRLFLSLVAGSAPLFLVNGNHEQAAGYNLDGTPDNVAVWAQTTRNKYFPQPAPDNFYTGNEQPVEHIGLLRDYYAWTWGDALFVVVDPYWYTGGPAGNVSGGGPKAQNKWNITLGDEQYEWFKRTLEQSDAKFKFVFAHHVLGAGRGGVEIANLYEWGGYDWNGYYEFDTQRPGWALPIHQVMVNNGVTIFFQGHDHVFAKQDLDGVIYQTLPVPADPNYDYVMNHADAYTSGFKLPNSGRVRVTVSDSGVTVDYISSYLPGDETNERKDGEIAYTYTVTQ